VAPGLASEFATPREDAPVGDEDESERVINAFVGSKISSALQGFDVRKTESGEWSVRRRKRSESE
jgi:hypothetical protein